jgi:hypothetical protein
MYTYRIYLDGGNLVIGTYESNVLKGEAKHLPRGLVAIAGSTNTNITLNRVVNNLPTLANIEHPNLRDSNGNVWGANRTAVIAAINSFIQSTGGGNVISVNGQTGTVSLGLQNLVNVTTITPTQGDVLSYNTSGNWVLNGGLQTLLSKVKTPANQTIVEADTSNKITIDTTAQKVIVTTNGTTAATFGSTNLLPNLRVGPSGNTYDLPATRGNATGQVPIFDAISNTTTFKELDLTQVTGNTDDITEGTNNLFNVNADWNVNDPTSGAYIANRPNIPAEYDDADVDTHLNTATATTGQVLSWNGTDYDWVNDQGGLPAGNSGEIQFNNAGSFGASSNLFYDAVNNRLGVGTNTPTESISVHGNILLGPIQSNATDRKLTIAGYNNAQIEFNLHDGWGKPTIAAGFGGSVKFVNYGVQSTNLDFVFGESSSRQGSMRFYSNSNEAIKFGTNAGYPISYLGVFEQGSNYQGGLIIKTRSSPTVTNDFVFDRYGYLGIGTTTPAYKLDVNGTTRIQSDLTVTTTNATGDFATIDASNILRKRTAAQVLTDIGAQAALTNPITGTGASGQVAFWNASNTQTGDNGLFWDNTNKRLGIGTITPLSSLGVIGKIALNDGNSNLAIGDSALGSLSTATNVIGIGVNAGTNLSTSSTNVFIGNNSGSNRNSAIIIGHGSGAQSSGSGLICIGHNSFTGANSQPTNIVIGNNLLQNASHSLYNNIFIGGGGSSWNSVANSNTIIGIGSATHALAQVESITIVGASISFPTVYGESVSVGAYAKSGRYSVMVGKSAGITNSSSSVAIGFEAAGTSNSVFVGYQAGKGASSTGTGNHGVGYQALLSYTTGANNTAIGYRNLVALTTQNNNTTLGHGAGESCLNDGNVFIGQGAAQTYNRSGGGYNVVIGQNASIDSGSQQNTTVGHGTSAFGNAVAIGLRASAQTSSVAIGMDAKASGIQSVSIGLEANRYTTGTNNVSIGNTAGRGASGVSTFDSSIAIGAEALRDNTTGNNVAVGAQAMTVKTSGTANTAIGTRALGLLASTNYNTAVGHESSYRTTGSDNTSLGYYANRNSTGSFNVAIGSEALEGVSGTSTFSNTTAIGYQALTALTTGTDNTAVGYQSGASLTTGSSNTFIGRNAGGNLTTQGQNVAVGAYALQNNINSFNKTAVGYNAGQSGMGSYDIAIGWYAGAGAANTGGFNIKIGETAGRFHTGGSSIIIGNATVLNSTKSQIIAIGGTTESGANSVVIGVAAGNAAADNSVIIGHNAGRNNTRPNTLFIENSNSATPLIYGEFDNDLVTINGRLEVANENTLRLYELATNGTNYIALKSPTALSADVTYTLPVEGVSGQALVTNGSGTLSWEYPKAPVKSEAGTAYTLVVGDAGKYIRMTATTAITVTIPENTFAVGDEIMLEQNNTGQVTIAAGTGVTLRNTTAFLSKTAERYAIVGLKCVASNEFVLTGERELV